MDILITGGTGRIGLHLIKVLKKEKIRVLVRPDDERIKELPKNIEIVYGDLLDKNSLEKAVSGIDIIYHLAAIVDYLAPKNLMYKVNVEGTKNLLEATKNVKKFIYLSSTAVYGKNLFGIADENTSCRPDNYYGFTKLEAEKLVLKNNGIVIRSADVYGPGFEEGYHQIFSLLEKNKLPIIGSGKNRIQYIYIDDLISALLLAKNAEKGEIYLIAGKDIKNQEDLFKICCRYLKVEPPEKHSSIFLIKLLISISMLIDKIKGKKPKMIPEYIYKITADRIFNIEKAEKELNWKPKVEYKYGIKKMVEYYKKHIYKGF